MSLDEREDTTVYRVVMNQEEQYSIWPVGRELPAGWRDEGFQGNKQACLERIQEIWTNMRPIPPRRRAGDAAGQGEA